MYTYSLVVFRPAAVQLHPVRRCEQDGAANVHHIRLPPLRWRCAASGVTVKPGDGGFAGFDLFEVLLLCLRIAGRVSGGCCSGTSVLFVFRFFA